MSRVATKYKKKEGSLATDDDRKYLFWTPAAPANAPPSLTIPIGDITNLQQTPATIPKTALRVFVQAAGAKESSDHVFNFTSPTAARKEQEAITEVLRNAISALKAGTVPRPTVAGGKPVQDETGKSASMAIAQAISGAGRNDGYDDSRLRADIELQQSLLEVSPALKQRFSESLREKPDSISLPQFSSQFWSSRLHLLRAHAMDKAQTQGDYNVLPDFKYKRIPVEGQPDKVVINLAKEQIQLLFKQYPVVREAYNESVPQIDANQFWSRFFNSRLMKKLRGEKITEHDPTDMVFDKYLDWREKGPALMAQVPNFIDLEGNEQNHSQRKGNRPDETMRAGDNEKVPILRVLNSLSEKMLSRVRPSDAEMHGPIGMDEGTFEELQLRDLQAQDEDNRVKLNIQDRSLFSSGDGGSDLSADALRYAKQDPEKVLKGIQQDLSGTGADTVSMDGLSLDDAIGIQSDSDDSDEDMDDTTNGHAKKSTTTRMGGAAALDAATSDVMSAIEARRAADSNDEEGTYGLSQATFDNLVMAHNTTIEFLHYFWTLFLSGDASRTSELARLVETLDKSVDRIHAVGKTAEEERGRQKRALAESIAGLKQTSAKRRRLEKEIDELGGGKKAVDRVIAPTMNSLAEATRQYRKAFEEQSATAAAA